MKTWILAFILSATFAQASQITLFDELDGSLPNYQRIEVALQVDQTTNQGFALIKATRTEIEWSLNNKCRDCDHSHPIPVTVTVFTKTVNIPNLTLEGDKLVYRGSEGAVECATFGLSHIFKIPTLYMSGKCSTDSQVIRVDGQKRLQVLFLTK